MNEEIKQKFCREFGSDRVLLEEPMKRHTTFRIGGPAEVFVMPGILKRCKNTGNLQDRRSPVFYSWKWEQSSCQ